MNGEPIGFWGKLTRGSGGEVATWHPLKDHCIDVAMCAEHLLARTPVGRRLARVAGLSQLSDVQVERLSVLAGLHDLGKFNHTFQDRAAHPDRRGGHVGEAAALFYVASMQPAAHAVLLDAASFEQWMEWAGPPEALISLWCASIGHHGGPPNRQSLPGDPGMWLDRSRRSPAAGVRELMGVLRGAFPLAFSDAKDTLPASPGFQHAFAGLVMLADWVGSDAGEDAFRYTLPQDETPRTTFARDVASRILSEIGLDPGPARQSLAPWPSPFASISPFPTQRPAQQAVADLEDPPDGSIVIMEAETGSGKTEAALAHFARLFDAGRVDGLYFALPTRSAATQLHGRVVAACDRMFEDANRPAVTLAVPGYLRSGHHHGRRLPGFEVQWPDEIGARHRHWASEHPKRYLAGLVVVGTIDQVLLGVLPTRHAWMRSTALMRQLLVVDEVHASDVYMEQLLLQVLHEHRTAGGQAMLLSATLGTAMRARLFRESVPPLSEAMRRPYPLVSVGPHPVVDHAVTQDAHTKQVRCEARTDSTPDAVARIAAAAAVDGARVLVIRNLVRDAIATQRALEDAGAPTLAVQGHQAPHHSRFPGADRVRLDAAVQQALGRSSTQPMVVCATQTVEQSLDIDADLLITDLAPIDVLLQRIGRLHRHRRENRPPKYSEPLCVVLGPSVEWHELLRPTGEARGPHGWTDVVYPDLRVLAATWREVKTTDIWSIPGDNRRLVEACTHPEALAQFHGDAWETHSTHIVGVQRAQHRTAAFKLIDRTRDYLDTPIDRDEVGQAMTRLGANDIEVDLDTPRRTCFGSTVSSLRISAYLLRGVDLPDTPAETWECTEGFEVRLGSCLFTCTRFGVERVDD